MTEPLNPVSVEDHEYLLPDGSEDMPAPDTGDESETGIPATPSQVTAVIRTITPYIVGLLASGIAWLAGAMGFTDSLPAGIEGWLQGVVPVLLGSGYYILAKWLEKKFPSVPWLGSTKKPLYTEPGAEISTPQDHTIASFLAQPYRWFRGKKACNCLEQAVPIAEKELIRLGAIKKDVSGLVTQGAYNNTVSASAGTHGGGGVWDVKWTLVNTDDKKRAWFNAGIIPFERTKVDSRSWVNHGHLVVAGCPHRAVSAVAQEVSARIGRNALKNGARFRGWMPDTIITWSQAVKLNNAIENAPKIPRVYTAKPWPWIVEDGILGKQTLDRLRMQLNVEVSGIGKLTHYDVAALFVWLGYSYTGSGIITKSAVITLQKRVGATPDGVWGPQTTRQLQKFLNKNRSGK